MIRLPWMLVAIALGAPSPELGVNIHFTGAPSKDLDMIQGGGFGWVRMDFAWGAVEREKGTYRFDAYDALVDGLAARGIRALFILDYSNSLYEPDRSVRTPEGRGAFARFAEAAAARYRGRGVRWEIWNEPNLEMFWKPQPAADDYAALVIEASRAIRKADPSARILAPASSGFPWEFLDRIFALGVLDHIDEVSVHPYRGTPPETVRDDYTRLRRLISKHLGAGREPPPIVSGEWGYSTWHFGGQPFSAETQGTYLARQFLTNLSEGIPLSIWYDWANDGPDPKETEHNFGTVTQDRIPKPAYQAARTLTTVLAGARFERRLEVSPDVHLLVFRSGERRILAAWTSGAARQVWLSIPGVSGRLEVTRFTGEPETVEGRGGGVELPLDGGPRYLSVPPGTGAGAGTMAAHGLQVDPRERGLRVTAARCGEGTETVVLEVRGRGDKDGKEEVLFQGKLVLEDGKAADVDVPLAWPAEGTVSICAVLRSADGDRVLARSPERSYGALGIDLRPRSREGSGDGATGGLSAVLDGESSVAGEAALSTVSLEAEPDPPAASALRLDYTFGRGWRFVRVVPGERPEVRSGILSVWVKGDGSGNTLRCRVADARGETFQPHGLPIDWEGWRRVEIPVDGSGAGSWGGDGTADPPLRWDTIFLLDSTRAGGSGRVEFAAPVLVEDE